MKKTLKIAGIVLLLLLACAFAAPFLLSGKIKTLIKTQVNKQLAARVDFSDVDLSLFRNFPRLAVALDGLQVTGLGEFAEDTLLSARRIDVALDLLSVLSGDKMTIHAIKVDQPRIHAIVHENGHANWAITIPDSAVAGPAAPPASSKPFKMALRQYSIVNAYISYKDEVAHMSSEISGLDHSGSGDFSSELFTLQTKTSTTSLSFTYGAIPYLIDTRTDVAANFEVDNKAGKYSFKIDNLLLNDLKLNTDGFFQLVNDSTYNMDIRFNGPSLDFKHILSLVPAIYKKDFASIRASGQASVSGFVKGIYDSKHIPAYHVDLNIKDGSFQYPDLPKPVKKINIALKADNPDGVTDHTVLDISRGHIEMDEVPFDFRLYMKTPVSDPYVDAAAKGQLDLTKVAQFVKLDKGTQISGLLNADMYAKGNLSGLKNTMAQTKGQAGALPGVGKKATPEERFDAGGTIRLTSFRYTSASYPTGIDLDNLLLSFNPQNVTLSDLKGAYGKTHFAANGRLDNLLIYMLKGGTLDGMLNLKADQINLNDWMGVASVDTTTAAATTGAAASGNQAPAVNGQSAAPFAVPGNIRFAVHAAVDRVHYNTLDMDNLSGSLTIADETVQLDNIQAAALGGTMVINGAYSSRDSKKNPAIAFRYDVKDLDVQKTFYTFTTVQKLMPIGKFIAGKFSSQLTMNGKMGANNTPDLNSLNGDGSLALSEGALNNFGVTDKLAQVLHLDQFKSIPVKDIKTKFAFRDGRVIVDPFHIKMKDIDMEIVGSHGFDQSMDYTANLDLPRSLLGGQANAAVNNVIAQANAKGIAVKANERVNLPVKIGGTITNPAIKTDVAAALSNTAGGLKQQATDLVKAHVDSAKQQLRDTVRSVGGQILKDAGNQLKNLLPGNKDTAAAQQPAGLEGTKKKVEEAGKGLLDGLLKKKKNE